MKKFKKLISLVLAVLMMLAVMPVAFAEEETTAADTTESDSFGAGDLFGGFFIKIGELLNTIFAFLSNLFSGTNGNDALDAIK